MRRIKHIVWFQTVWHSGKEKIMKISGCLGWRKKWRLAENFRQCNFSAWYNNGWYMSYICQTDKCTTPRENSNKNYGLWVILIFQCSLLIVTLRHNSPSPGCLYWGGWVGGRVVQKIDGTLCTFHLIFCELKTYLKNKPYF